VQSPVFVNYDPSWETASYASDWEEYYSDEYWDQGKPKKREPKRDSITGAESTIGTENLKTKRRKGKSNGIPSLSLGEPSLAGSTVVWKPKKETLESCDGTIVNDGHGESVSLLPDVSHMFCFEVFPLVENGSIESQLLPSGIPLLRGCSPRHATDSKIL